jgi:hypothetical protein
MKRWLSIVGFPPFLKVRAKIAENATRFPWER